MKPISIYKPVSVDEAIKILSLHGTEAGVYAGGTDLLIRLKNRLTQAPTYLVDIKKIDNLRYIRETPDGGVQIGAPPGALANAIYNACGVRIREHPITREKIMAGLKELKARGGTIA